MKSYKLIAGSAAEAFHNSRAKIPIYAGGFGNGKTTALVIDALKVMMDYPGCNIMLGRASHVNLMKTVYREFFKWCPPNWIKSTNKNEGTCTLVNGSNVDFRYVAEQASVNAKESTSNLLSANYDYIGIDQIEDVEITEHDFDQMLGRLRGQTPYAGDDPTMPATGPRRIALTCNPSIGWVYKRLVKPLHDLRAGRWNNDLVCVRDPNTDEPILDENDRVQPLVELFEASTYENAQNLTPDFIQTLEATYRGRMRDRYLLGKWVAFEGVVYDEFDAGVHMVAHEQMMEHITGLRMSGYELQIVEGYDHGIAAPSCYLLALVDGDGVVYVLDGYYERNMGITAQAALIEEKRAIVSLERDRGDSDLELLADPAIFRRSAAGKLVGTSVAAMFAEEGIHMQRGNNAILNGIIKVKAYIAPKLTLINPFTGALGGPMIYFSDRVSFIEDEITVYRWQKTRDQSMQDKPVDGEDHAMDTIKYMLSRAPEPARMGRKARPRVLPRAVQVWGERSTDDRRSSKEHRYN